MMSEKALKYIFYAVAAVMLIIMIYLSRLAGISCDEVLHYGHSEAVYSYFATGGEDKSALDTPETHLKYYGQSYDNTVTILIHWFGIDDVYAFRHIMSALAGWAVILITALFAVWLSCYRTGIIVLLLFAVSPAFMGHAMNNLKDVPFALGYAASVFLGLKFMFSDRKNSFADALLLTVSIAFALSIRAGGLLLLCYLFLFWFTRVIFNLFLNRKITGNSEWKRLTVIVLVSGAAFFMSILLWPFALQDPFRNVYESFRVMAHFPSTFRQIFEGEVMWSDNMPWYYIPKSMAITIPLVVLSGIAVFMVFVKSIFIKRKSLLYGLVVFSIIFPLVFVMIQKSNLYSSWRQFLFLYPLIILIAAVGFSQLFEWFRVPLLRWVLAAFLLFLSVHPVKFMATGFPYSYIYYNQLAGGLKGAHGNYETDYYYIGQTEASQWLIKYLYETRNDSAVVKATFSVKWHFRDYPEIHTSYFRNEERSMYDWDYAIITNRYIPPYRLKNGTWPPWNAIEIIYADQVPVCAVLERKTKADYHGYKALQEGRNGEAIVFFEEALLIEEDDEMIFYNFARALYNDGQAEKADSALKRAIEINPEFEPALMYLGNIAAVQGKDDTATEFYDRVIGINRKYFEAYVAKAGLIAEKNIFEARELLRSCLKVNPRYKPAIVALADTYRKSNPEIAEKYDRLAGSIR